MSLLEWVNFYIVKRFMGKQKCVLEKWHNKLTNNGVVSSKLQQEFACGIWVQNIEQVQVDFQ